MEAIPPRGRGSGAFAGLMIKGFSSGHRCLDAKGRISQRNLDRDRLELQKAECSILFDADYLTLLESNEDDFVRPFTVDPVFSFHFPFLLSHFAERTTH